MKNIFVKIAFTLLICSLFFGLFVCGDIVFRNGLLTNKIISKIESRTKCKDMNGWWAIADLPDLTITAPKVHWDDLNGTIELFKGQEISRKFSTKYVLLFTEEKDGYSRTDKCYIGTPNGFVDYEYYIYFDEYPDEGIPMKKIND